MSIDHENLPYLWKGVTCLLHPHLPTALHLPNSASSSPREPLRAQAVKLDKLPEYLRDTVDWFMGKTRGRKDREYASETKLYLQEPCLERKIQEDELLSITEVPEGLDPNEWLALHTIGFFEHINLLYGTVSEFCNLSSCPDMVGPGQRTYMWVDEKGKKSKLSAPQYVDYVMTYVQKTVNDELLFPTKHGHEFPTNFDQILRRIQKLLFHVVAHIYHSHFREIVLLGLHAHLNSIFAHIIEFNLCHQVLEDKETEVLQDLIHALKLHPEMGNPGTSGSPADSKESLEISGDHSSHSSPNSSLSRPGGEGEEMRMSPAPPDLNTSGMSVEQDKSVEMAEGEAQSDDL